MPKLTQGSLACTRGVFPCTGGIHLTIRKTVRFYSVKYSYIRYINILSNWFNSSNSSSNLATQTHHLIKYLNSKVAIFGTMVPNLTYILFSPYAIGT